MTRELGSSVRSGVKVSLAATIATGIIQIASMTVLARLLGPADYGFFATAVAVNGITVAVLISVSERALVFDGAAAGQGGPLLAFVGLMLGVALAVLGACAAIGALTGWPIHTGILAIVLGAGVVQAIGTARRALLRREIRFGWMVAGDLIGLVAGNFLTAMTLAWAGLGGYALALGNLVAAIVSTAWIVARGAGRPRRGVVEVRAVAPKALRMLRVAGLEALNGQVAPLVVSSTLGPVPLGLFNRVYTIVSLPVQMLVSSLYRVVISALVSVADHPARRTRAANLMLRMACAFMTPLTLGLAASGRAFVATLLGPKWLEAVPLIPFLALAVWGSMLGTLLGQVAEAMQRFEDKARVQAISTTALVVLLLVGSLGGTVGVAAAYMVGSLLFAFLSLRVAARILELPATTLIGWMGPSVIAGGAALLAALLVRAAMARSPEWAILAAQIAACGGATGLAYLVVDRALVAEIAATLLPARISAPIGRWMAVRPTG